MASSPITFKGWPIFSVGQPKQLQPNKIGQPKVYIGGPKISRGRPLSFVNWAYIKCITEMML